MSSFNVEKEVECLLKDHIIDQEVGSPTALHYNLCSLLTRCCDATEEAVERECIRSIRKYKKSRLCEPIVAQVKADSDERRRQREEQE